MHFFSKLEYLYRYMNIMNKLDNLNERTVWVSNLDERVTEELLKELFIQMGPVESVTIRGPPGSAPLNSTGGGKTAEDGDGTPKSRQQSAASGSNVIRFAFIEFSDESSVLFACEMMDHTALFGKRIRVKPRERTEKFQVYTQIGLEKFIMHKYLSNNTNLV